MVRSEDRFVVEKTNNDFSSGKTPVSAFCGSSTKHFNKSETLFGSGDIRETNRNQDHFIAGDSLNST